jgi:hypothetical protein
MEVKEIFSEQVIELSSRNQSKLSISGESIKGVSICTAGEAKGHGLHIEKEFIQSLVSAGSASDGGIKARFGHPSFFSDGIGTFIGVFKNFRLSDDGLKALADLELSSVAKKSPHGDLFTYVLEMAENHPMHFGTSIVNDSPVFYQYDSEGKKLEINSYSDYNPKEKLFMGLGEFTACDVVDQPAANSGLFSKNQNSNTMTKKFKKLLSKLFLAETEPLPDPQPIPELEVGSPKIGNVISFRNDIEEEFLIPDGEFLISAGDMADSVLIVKDGKITEIKPPVTETEKLSLAAVEKLPLIQQLQATVSKLQTELDKAPAGNITTVISKADEFSRNGKFKSEAFSKEANEITEKYQLKS